MPELLICKVQKIFFSDVLPKGQTTLKVFSHSPSLSARPLPHPQAPTLHQGKSRADSGQRTNKPHKKKRKSEGWKEKSIKEKAEP